jgi:ATP-dependent Lon protease
MGEIDMSEDKNQITDELKDALDLLYEEIKSLTEDKNGLEDKENNLKKLIDEYNNESGVDELVKYVEEIKNKTQKLVAEIKNKYRQPFEIKITNNIEIKVNEYILQNGVSKVFIAMRMGMSKQALYSLFKSPKPTIDNLEKMAYILDCKVSELYSKEIIEI